MKILAVDTSSAVCSAAVFDGRRMISEVNVDYKMTHSEALMPILDACLEYARLRIQDVDLFAVAAGPGSFTGVRIGMCAVKAMAQATGKKIAVVDTLEALVQNVCGYDGTVCPLIDARRGQVYYAAFRKNERVWEDQAGHIDEVIEKLHGERTLFVGDGVFALREYITERMPNAEFADGSILYQRAASAVQIALKKAEEDRCVLPEEAAPNYIRESGAVRKKMGR